MKTSSLHQVQSMQFAKSKSIAKILHAAAFAIGAALLVPGIASADDIVSGGLKASNVTIEKVDGDKILYKTNSGSNSDKTINEKLQVIVSDEPNLTAAEEAFVKAKYSDAVDGYQKIMRSTSKAWLKDYAAYRLIKSGEKADRFDAVVTGYIAVLQKNPTFAKDLKITIPTDPKNTYLKTADTQLDTAINATKDQTTITTLLSFQMNVCKAMGNTAKVNTIATRLTGQASSGAGAAVDATTLSNIVEGNLSLITASLEKKDYAGALKSLEGCKANIIEQKHQIEWLWLNAEANSGLLGDSKDAVKLKELALDYLRVSANFSGTPRAGEALVKTGKILEKMGDTKAATAIFQQVEREFKGQPIASEAKANLTRLGGK